MPGLTPEKSFAAESPALGDYVRKTFHPDDQLLEEVSSKRMAAAGMPQIHVSALDGLHLEVIARAAGAKKIVEIGTLAGFSGVCLARALPEGGILHTFEFEPKHAEVARETFRRCKVDHKIKIHVGPALENLPKIEKEGPFDLVFIDADKPSYPAYLRWAAAHLRMGGVVLADNAFAGGMMTLPPDDPSLKKDEKRRQHYLGIDATNTALGDPKGPFRGTMIPTGEGLAMGVKVAKGVSSGPPPIQILMAVYNGSAFLGEQLDSIDRQTCPDWRLLIRDNLSTDSTWSILQERANRDPKHIGLLRAQTHGDALSNFAALLDHADADYVMFADADDVWLPDKITRTLEAMKNMEARFGAAAPLLVHTDLKVTNADLSVRHDSLWSYQGVNPAAGLKFNRLLIENGVTGCTMMLNRPLVELARPVPRGPGHAIMHDWWIALVAAAFGHISAVSQPLMLYRQHGRNDTGAKEWRTGRALAKITRFFDTRELDEVLARTQRQAAAFLERYRDRLPPESARMVAAYAQLGQRNFFSRRASILAHGFYRTGVIRNLSLLMRV